MSASSTASAGEMAWRTLEAELDQWQHANQTAFFWWRDDDAAEVSTALERLLALQNDRRVPLVVAVVPAQASEALANRIANAEGIVAVQHGFRHRNHATSKEKKSEFPSSRQLQVRLNDLEEGQRTMDRLFPERARRPLLVPPWNRLGSDLIDHLSAGGFIAISTFQHRQRYWAAPGLAQLNTHIDPVDWRTGNSAAGCLQAIVGTSQSLEQIRLGEAPVQPIGLLTHHLRHDEMGWAFIAEFIGRITAHPAAKWLDVDAALEIGRPAADVISTS